MPTLQGPGRLAFGSSIRGRFGRALVVAGLTPLVALSVVFVSSQRDDLEMSANDSLAGQARLQAAAVASVLRQAEESITVLAANPALVHHDDVPEAELRMQLEAYGLFDEVTFLDMRGVVIESTSYRFVGRWDANAAFRGAREGRHVMTPPLYYPDPERLVVEHAAPILNDGAVVAVVVGTMNMERVWQALDGVSIGQTGFYAAFDRSGNVIAHPDKARILSKLEGYPLSLGSPGEARLRFRTADGGDVVGYAAPVDPIGWHVAALQPASETFALANAAETRILLAAAVVLLVAAVLAVILSRAISRPIRTVGIAMRRITDGDLQQRVDPPGLGEIDDLADSFNLMAGELEERSSALQAEMEERDRAEEKIKYQAYHDSLTGLPNRMLLKDRLDVAQADSRRTGEPLAVMFLDLDRFKLVNDSMGHSSGDELLLGVSDRITGALREGDSLARVGGDEYVLLLPRVSGPERAVEAARRVMQSLRKPWDLNGRDFHVTASIGIAMYPGDGTDSETLMRNADTAMYQAKADGRDRVRRFEAAMDDHVQERVELERDLRRALSLEQFTLHYQPQVDTRSGQVVGMEALVRWQSPERGLVPPNTFIPIAEETGLIWDLGRWVLREACSQVQSWRKAGLLHDIPVAVNVSPRQFHDVGIVDEVRATLAATGLPASQLELEITESTAMRDVEHSVQTLTQLKETGVRVSIDDFGTGYSSLSYLKRFPIDTVKIDRSFVMDIAQDPDDASIVSAIIVLAESLTMNTVAEGVETEEQLAFLRERNCGSFQGFIYSPALPADELAQLLSDEAPPVPRSDRPLPAIGPQLASAR